MMIGKCTDCMILVNNSEIITQFYLRITTFCNKCGVVQSIGLADWKIKYIVNSDLVGISANIIGR